MPRKTHIDKSQKRKRVVAKVRRYRLPRVTKRPGWDDVRGIAPNATGDLSSEAFVRAMRDDWT